VDLGVTSVFLLSQESLARSLAAGFELRHVTGFLASQSGTALPAEVEQHLADWARQYRRVRLRRAIVVTPDDAEAIKDIHQAVLAAGIPAQIAGESVVIEIQGDGTAAEAVIEQILRERGLTPLWQSRAR
jgi:hypothetical protein